MEIEKPLSRSDGEEHLPAVLSLGVESHPNLAVLEPPQFSFELYQHHVESAAAKVVFTGLLVRVSAKEFDDLRSRHTFVDFLVIGIPCCADFMMCLLRFDCLRS